MVEVDTDLVPQGSSECILPLRQKLTTVLLTSGSLDSGESESQCRSGFNLWVQKTPHPQPWRRK